MKLTAQSKKMKSALGKVSKSKVVKKKEKADSGIKKKKAALMEFACESLASPEKAEILKSLKKSKSGNSTPSSFQKPTKPKKNEVPLVPQLSKQSISVKTERMKKENKENTAVKGPVASSLNVAEKKLKADAMKVKKTKKVALKKSDVQSLPQEEEINDVSCSLNQNLLEGVSSATLKLINQGQENSKRKDLFGSQPQPIHLQLTVFKVPQTPYRKFRCPVPHSILTTDPDICLIVPDLKRGRKKDVTFAKLLETYEEKLEKNGTKGIKQILPFTQMRCEYSQFEMKRRLASTFDVFLCDGRIHGHCVHFLGNAFEKAKKVPIPIHAVQKEGQKLEFQPNLQNEVDNAIRKVCFTLHSHGTSYSIPVGHTQFTEKQLSDNVQAIWKMLEKVLPGGIENIKAAYLKGPRTMAVPLYASLTPPSSVPVVEKRSLGEPVEDELSTMPGCRVIVHPSGEVELVMSKDATAEDKELVQEAFPSKSKKRKNSSKPVKTKRVKAEESATSADVDKENEEVPETKDGDESDDDFKDVESAEAAYLAQWSESAALKELEEEEEAKKSQPKKKSKAKKKAAAKESTDSNGKKLAGLKGISHKFSTPKKGASKQTSKKTTPQKEKVLKVKKTKSKPNKSVSKPKPKKA